MMRRPTSPLVFAVSTTAHTAAGCLQERERTDERVVGWLGGSGGGVGRGAQMVLALVNQKPFRCKCHAGAKVLRPTSNVALAHSTAPPPSTPNGRSAKRTKRTQKRAEQQIRSVTCLKC